MSQPRARIASQLGLALAVILAIVISGSTVFALRSLDTANLATREEHLASEARLLADQLSTFHGTLRENTQRLSGLFEKRFSSGLSVHPDEPVTVAGVQTPGLHLGGEVLNNNFKEVDEFKQMTAGVATLFVRSGEDFVRVSTSLSKQDGSRAIGTLLDHAHPAYARLIAGQSYVGRALLFERSYMTQYTPVRDSSGKVIAVLFVGFDYTDAQNAQFDNLSVSASGRRVPWRCSMNRTNGWCRLPVFKRWTKRCRPSLRWRRSLAKASSGVTNPKTSTASPCRSRAARGRSWRACRKTKSAP